MGYTPKHAKPASLMDTALSSHALSTINAPSVGRHAASGGRAGTVRMGPDTSSRQSLEAKPPRAA